MHTCKIQWVDRNGQSTPDANKAIGRVRRKAYTSTIHGRRIDLPETEWFPICAQHAQQLADDGMGNWEFEPNPVPGSCRFVIMARKPRDGASEYALIDRGPGPAERYVSATITEHSLRHNEWVWGHYFASIGEAARHFCNRDARG